MRFIRLTLVAVGLAAIVAASAAAATTVVLDPGNTQGWSTAETRLGGTVSFVDDATTRRCPAALRCG